jgi:nitronate monooxygenase
MALYAGAGVGRVTTIVGAAERVRAIAAEASDLLKANAVPPTEPVQLASPACLAHEMDDCYMGFATRDELLPVLNELLEAERAGARVTLATAKEIAGDDLEPLVLAIHRDEARWCGVLTRAIHQLQGAPSPKTGAFYEKAMAIPDLPARLAFLNRGQGWVVRKLKALLPTIRDEAIYADLTTMLASHERNIGLVAAELLTPDRIGAPL